MIPNRREMNLVFREDLYSFVAHSFRFLEPGNLFIRAAYLELLCAALMQVGARAVRRLVINMPPRHLKSIVTSVVFPAWVLMRDPKTKVAVICHSDMLGNDLASKSKRLIEFRRLPADRASGADQAGPRSQNGFRDNAGRRRLLRFDCEWHHRPWVRSYCSRRPHSCA